MSTQEQDHSANLEFDRQDFMDTMPVMPVNKLDADQYSADDIDGSTESIFGSGNLAYASLQASQADTFLLKEDADFNAEHAPEQMEGPLAAFTPADFADLVQLNVPKVAKAPTDTDRAIGQGDNMEVQAAGNDAHYTGATVGSLGASALSSDNSAFSVSGGGGSGGDTGYSTSETTTTSSTVTNGNITNDTTTTTTVINNYDETGDKEDIHIDVDIDIGETVENVLNTVNETVNNITDLGENLIDTVINLGDEVIQNILANEITDIVNNLYGDVTNIVDTLNTEINNLTDTATDITNNLFTVTNDLTENVTNIVNDFTDQLLGGGISIDLGLNGADTLLTDLHVGIDDSISGSLDVTDTLGNLSLLAEDITGIALPAIDDTGLNIGFGLLGGADSSDGSDIVVAGLNLPEIPLDLVESIVGDIDIQLDAPTDLLTDPASLIGDAASFVENLGDLDLADVSDILETLGDQGAGGAIDIVLGDTELGQAFDTEIGELTDDITAGLGDTVDNLVPDSGALDDITGSLDETLDLLDGNATDEGVLDLLDDVSGASADAVDLLGDAGENGNLLGELIDDITDMAGDTFGDAVDLLGGADGTDTDDVLGNLTGNVDVTIDDALALLGGGAGAGAGDLLDGALGVDGDTSWTESTVDAGGLFDDVLTGIGGEADALPDPVGTVAEGLGVLDVDPDAGSGLLGGLFG